MDKIRFSPPPPDDRFDDLRQAVRGFTRAELRDHTPADLAQSWSAADPAFSRKLGAKGWLGMTWPERYGGHGRSALERYVVQEELLAAGAPVGAHWIADRQSGPLLLRFGTEQQKQEFLPRIARGECYFSIGMSEPEAGSDLAAIRTRAVRDAKGYVVNGTKLWTTNALTAQYMLVLCRTSPADGSARHEGLSQLVVDLSLPGVTVRPMQTLSGHNHIAEVSFTDLRVPRDALVGTEGNGWHQVTSELAFERSGPDRFLSSFPLFTQLNARLAEQKDTDAAAHIGRLATHLVVLRVLSRGVAAMLERGADPNVQAAIVKDLGTTFEQEVVNVSQRVLSSRPALDSSDDFEAVLAYAMLEAPTFSIRGGTREVLRGVIARGLGTR